MKKSLVALAALGVFAGAASAQSSVTLYGGIDQAFGKALGSADRRIADTGYGTRLGFRGVEGLGGGLSAVFGFEHRFEPSTGDTVGGRIWGGHSWVGVRGGFGQVTLGRHYTAAFLNVQNQVDPWAGAGFASLRNWSTIGIGAANIPKVRADKSIRYDGTFSGVSLALTAGEAPAPTNRRPTSAAISYAAGPLWAGVGYERTFNRGEDWLTLGLRYNFGFATAHAAYSRGEHAAGYDVRSYLLGATVPVGTGAVLAGWTRSTNDNPNPAVLARSQKASLGYRHPLSRRTLLYTGVSRGSGNFVTVPAAQGGGTERNAYEFGVRHLF
jgi:predicted porin